jgi:hypothetical protein
MRKLAIVAAPVISILAIATFLSWWYYVDLLALQASASKLYEPWTGDAMDHHLRSLARFGAANCGRVRLHDDAQPAAECIINAFKFRRSFYVRYDLRGIDSEIAAGMVGKSPDEVYAVAYNIPWGWSDEESPPGTRISDDRHLLTEPCPKPIRLIETPSGRLTCFPPDANAKPNIMSPTFGPY